MSLEGLPKGVKPRLWGVGGGCSPSLLPALPLWGCPGALCSRSLSGPVAPSGMMARLARCHLSRHLRSRRLSPIRRMTTSRAGRTTSPGMKVPLRWAWEEAQWARCQPVVGGRGIALPACTPRAFPFRPGAAVGSVRSGKQQLVPRRLPSCSLNGALCRAGWWPALPGLPWGVPACPSPSLPPSPGHHQGPLPEGEVQPAQGVRGAGLPARHVHQPQEAGAQVGARRRRGRAAAGGKGARGGGSAPSRPCQDQAAGPQGARGLQALPRRPGGCRLRLRRPHLQLGGKDSGTRRGDGALCPVPPRRRPAAAPQCKLEQQACLASKQLTVRCEGQCPCPTPHSPAGDSKQGEWSARHRGTVPELCPA